MIDFNTQICTTREQSERLLAIGLKAETADMMHDAITVIKGRRVEEPMWSIRTVYYPHKSKFLYDNEEQVFIPAWSLHRLLMIYDGNCNFHNLEDAYNELIDAIEKEVMSGSFNKDHFNK